MRGAHLVLVERHLEPVNVLRVPAALRSHAVHRLAQGLHARVARLEALLGSRVLRVPALLEGAQLRRHQLLHVPPSRMQNWDGEVLLRRQLPP